MSSVEAITNAIAQLPPVQVGSSRLAGGVRRASMGRTNRPGEQEGRLNAWPNVRLRSIRPGGRDLCDTPHDCGRLGVLRAIAGGGASLADDKYALLRSDPHHPSLHFKRVGRLWSVRVGQGYRSPGRRRWANLVLDRIARRIRPNNPRGVRPLTNTARCHTITESWQRGSQSCPGRCSA